LSTSTAPLSFDNLAASVSDRHAGHSHVALAAAVAADDDDDEWQYRDQSHQASW